MQISAFVDGELPENETELLVRRLSQDRELRKDVAEYLALGRLMRAEAGLAGADRLNERIAAEIDERPADAADTKGALRFVRPLVGFAIAVTVALAAIFTLQQTAIVGDAAFDAPQSVATDEVQPGVPNIDAQLERQRSIFRSHTETILRHGASGFNSKVVDLHFSEEIDEDYRLKQLQQDVIDAGDSDIEAAWVNYELPSGFATVAAHEEVISGSYDMVTHILFSDGLANVSVFVSPIPISGAGDAGAASMGGSNSFCAIIGDFEITAIGEVPAATLQQIATTMRQP